MDSEPDYDVIENDDVTGPNSPPVKVKLENRVKMKNINKKQAFNIS